MSVVKNSVVSMVGTAAPLVLTVFTLPLFLGTIGAERYGAIAICWLILTYIGRADFGVARAATQRIAACARVDEDAIPRIAATAIVLGTLMSAILGLASYAAAHWYFSGPLDMSATVRAELVSGSWLIGMCTLVVSLFAVIYGCLVGREMFNATAMSTLLVNTGSLLLPLGVAVFFTIDLYWLLVATLAARVLGALPASALFWRMFMTAPTARPSIEEAKRLLHYGKWVMVMSIARPIMLMTDRIMIGAQIGAIAVAAYAMPFQIASRLQLIPQSVLLVLFPRMAADDHAQARQRTQEYMVVFANFFAPIMVGGICMAEPLMRIWLGSDLDERSVLLARLVLAGCWISGMAGVANNFVMARGDSRFAAVLRLVQLPVYVGAMYLAAEYSGLYAVAIVFGLLQVWDLVSLSRPDRLIDLGVLKKTALSVVTVFVPILLHGVLYGWIASMLAAFVFCGVCVLNAYVFTPAEQQAVLLQRLRGLLARK